MKKFISLLLAAVLTLSLAACSSRPALLGTYETTVDISDVIASWIDADLGEDLIDVEAKDLSAAKYIDQFEVTLHLEFNNDGTYVQSLDAASVEAAMEKSKPSLYIYLEALQKAFTIDKFSYFFTIETEADLESILDCTWEEYYNTEVLTATKPSFDGILGDYVIQLTDGEFTSEGNFKAEDGKLYMSYDLNDPIDESVYETYVIDGNIVTVTGGANREENDLLPSSYTMTKISEQTRKGSEETKKGFSLPAFGSSRLTGKYETTVDLTEDISSWLDDNFASQLLETEAVDFSLADYMDPFEITVNTEFKEDGSYCQTVDSASVEAAAKALEPALYMFAEKVALEFTMNDPNAPSAIETTEDLERSLGTSWEACYDTNLRVLNEAIVAAMLMEYTYTLTEDPILAEGKYKAEGGKLYMTTDLSAAIDEGTYETYEIDGDVVTVTGGVNMVENDLLSYPYTMTKVSE